VCKRMSRFSNDFIMAIKKPACALYTELHDRPTLSLKMIPVPRLSRRQWSSIIPIGLNCDESELHSLCSPCAFRRASARARAREDTSPRKGSLQYILQQWFLQPPPPLSGTAVKGSQGCESLGALRRTRAGA